jgi:fermentation-respiration switch protein FrsA (DUF1100 family)
MLLSVIIMKKKLLLLIVFCLFTNCSFIVSKASLFPDKSDIIDDTSLDSTIQPVKIYTRDNKSLHCYYLPEPRSNKILIYFHGNAGNIDQRIPELEQFRNLGVNVLGVGYRGYGKSTGRPSEKGIYKDGYVALRFAQDSLKFPMENIIVCGRSIGTTVAVEIAQHKNLAGVILVTPISSGWDQAKRMHIWFLIPFTGIPYNNLKKSVNIAAPVLIIHGTNDNVAPYQWGQKLFKRIKSNKQFITIKNGGHNNLEFVRPSLYWNSIGQFLNKETL